MNHIDIKAVREELVQALSQTFDGYKGVAVYGAGDTAERWFAPFLEIEVGDVEYFIDDTLGKSGTSLYNIPIINSDEAHSKCRSFLILLASIVPETRELMADSLRNHPIDGAEVCANWEEYVYCKHAEEVLSVFDMLGDDISKATYANMVLTRMGKASQDQAFTFRDQYFAIPPYMKHNIHEVFVDCGAYVGDTVERFICAKNGSFHKIFAFEPSERNFRAMKARAGRLTREWGFEEDQIKLIQAGTGEKTYRTELKIRNDATGHTLSGENVGEGEGVAVISVDDYFSDQSITFLKADIEGYEWKMLHGAERTIKRDQPKLAICIYHTPFDMYRIPLWIRKLCPEYKFEVRQHYCDIWDTVLYAYI